jgi:hypothetical protein
MNERAIAEKIRGRGCWSIRVRPYPFTKERVRTLAQLEEIIATSTVRFRGWDFPHTDQRIGVMRGNDYIANASEWHEHLEYWRFFQSGQFVDLLGMYEDWQDQSFSQSGRWPPRQRLGFFEVIYRLTEIFEFASRIALTPVGSENMEVQVGIAALRGRVLWMDDPHRAPLMDGREAAIESFEYAVVLTRNELVARTRDHALEPARRVYERFGIDLDLTTVRGLQDELVRDRS